MPTACSGPQARGRTHSSPESSGVGQTSQASGHEQSGLVSNVPAADVTGPEAMEVNSDTDLHLLVRRTEPLPCPEPWRTSARWQVLVWVTKWWGAFNVSVAMDG